MKWIRFGGWIIPLIGYGVFVVNLPVVKATALAKAALSLCGYLIGSAFTAIGYEVERWIGTFKNSRYHTFIC